MLLSELQEPADAGARPTARPAAAPAAAAPPKPAAAAAAGAVPVRRLRGRAAASAAAASAALPLRRPEHHEREHERLLPLPGGRRPGRARLPLRSLRQLQQQLLRARPLPPHPPQVHQIALRSY